MAVTQNVSRPVVLCIADGWGWFGNSANSISLHAHTPNFNRFWESSPHAVIDTSGGSAGLPDGHMGNSSHGHVNLGAGRVVKTDLLQINHAIAAGLGNNPALQKFIRSLQSSGGTCHLLGLASPGGVSSHQDHIIALAQEVARANVPVKLHAFLDGGDVPNGSGIEHVAYIQNALVPIEGVTFGTLVGRAYAMDRGRQWDRTKIAYDAMVNGIGHQSLTPVTSIAKNYTNGGNDQFMEPVIIGGYQGMKDGDGILSANFRTDNMLQVLSAFLDPDFKREESFRFASAACLMTDNRLNRFALNVIQPDTVTSTIGQAIADAGLMQLRLAEADKYAHATFFLNGARETAYKNERRELVSSPGAEFFDLQPDVMAPYITRDAIAAIDSRQFDFIVVGYSSIDSVGRNGSPGQITKAVEIIDFGLGWIAEAVEKQGGTMLFTATHGNMGENKSPFVPAVLVNAAQSVMMQDQGKLANLTPTLLELMGVPQPAGMERSLLLHARPA